MSAGRTDVDVNALKQAEPRETRASADTSLHVHELRARNIHISLVAQRRKKNKKTTNVSRCFCERDSKLRSQRLQLSPREEEEVEEVEGEGGETPQLLKVIAPCHRCNTSPSPRYRSNRKCPLPSPPLQISSHFLLPLSRTRKKKTLPSCGAGGGNQGGQASSPSDTPPPPPSQT